MNEQTLNSPSAIFRYCADIAGLTPSNPFTAAKVDQVISICLEFHQVWNSAISNGRDAHKAGDTKRVKAIVTQLRDVDGHKLFLFLERLLIANNPDEKKPGFIVGKVITIADIALWKMIGTLSQDPSTRTPVFFWGRELNDRYPHLKMLVSRINAHPGVHNYVLSLFPHGQGVSPFPGRMAAPDEGQWPGMGFSLEPPDVHMMNWWMTEFGLKWEHME